MSGRHVALIIEDEPDMAIEIADLLRSFGHDHIHAETLADGKACLERGGFCYVLLDLQIKADGQSIKPRVESGMSLLREIRRRFPRRGDNDMHLMPVIVISGHGREPQNMIAAFKDGIDDFILKPLSLDNQDVLGKIQSCLERAGRSDHGRCHEKHHSTLSGSSGGLEIFWHAPDYSEVRLHEKSFLFTGDVQRKAIRYLHEAASSPEPWRSGKLVLEAAGSVDTRLGNLFRRHPAWKILIISNGRGKYRLTTE